MKLGQGFTFTKSTWPDPQLSLGTKYNCLGGNECWEAVGPVQELFSKISASIGELLDALIDNLEEGEPVDSNILIFGMYMIGKNPATARPILLFTCQTPNPWQYTIKFLKKSTVLKGYSKIALAESSVYLLTAGRRYLRLLAGLSSSDTIVLGISFRLGIPVFLAGLATILFICICRNTKYPLPTAIREYCYSEIGEMLSSVPYLYRTSCWIPVEVLLLELDSYRASKLSDNNFTRYKLLYSYLQVSFYIDITTSNSSAPFDLIYKIGILLSVLSKPVPSPCLPVLVPKLSSVVYLDSNTLLYYLYSIQAIS